MEGLGQEVVEQRQGLRVGCIEEIAWREGFIDDTQLRDLAEPLAKSGYGAYLLDLVGERRGHRAALADKLSKGEIGFYL